eukprot:403349545
MFNVLRNFSKQACYFNTKMLIQINNTWQSCSYIYSIFTNYLNVSRKLKKLLDHIELQQQ